MWSGEPKKHHQRGPWQAWVMNLSNLLDFSSAGQLRGKHQTQHLCIWTLQSQTSYRPHRQEKTGTTDTPWLISFWSKIFPRSSFSNLSGLKRCWRFGEQFKGRTETPRKQTTVSALQLLLQWRGAWTHHVLRYLGRGSTPALQRHCSILPSSMPATQRELPGYGDGEDKPQKTGLSMG